MPTITKLFSMAEASEHVSSDDCWIVVDGKVYDVTKYLDEHPGGDDVLVQSAGKDATEEFEDAGHSKEAREHMNTFFIGEIDPSPEIIEKMEISKQKKPSSSSLFLSESSLLWALPAAVLGISAIIGFLYLRKK
ncbi:Cytochrome b5 isoform B [Zostera marina]|uniref:Cytochrome b5 isoform B n=1 Tax=Zostera marina TaxID=29655 RepID=A0A0K9PN48_ZOSMR|nr:Cytochrome b5 isoform B [Zostera marina]